MDKKELIKSIQQLKEIKPRKEWVILTKSGIFNEPEKTREIVAQKAGIMEILSLVFAQRKLAYSLAAFAFVLVGLVGFAKYTMPGDALFPLKKMAEQSTAALSGESPLKQSVVALNNRISDLAQAAKQGKKDSIAPAIKEVNDNAKELAANLKSGQADPSTIKEIANTLKTLADVPGTDLAANSDLADLYQAVVQNEISDLQTTNLQDRQKVKLSQAENLYNQGKYSDALEAVLSINQPDLINTTTPSN